MVEQTNPKTIRKYASWAINKLQQHHITTGYIKLLLNYQKNHQKLAIINPI